MRLQFQLNRIKVSPVCHIQINRHAEEFRGRYAIGQLYGSLYDDEGHVTNVVAYPDEENMSTPEQLQAIDRRHQDLLHTYNLDNSNIGWYMISYKQNFWEHLELVLYNEKYINTSFFLVYDYEARLIGKNPYKAFRLTDEFALRQNFNLSQFKDLEHENPFVEIPVVVQKNQLFETLMLFNKKQLIKEFMKNNNSKDKKDSLKNKIDSYVKTLQQQSQNNKGLIERRSKQQRNLNFNEFCKSMGIIYRADEQQKYLRKYVDNINLTKKIVSGNETN